MANLLFIVVLLVVGQLCRHVAAFPRDTDRALNQFVIHVSLPALVFQQIRTLELDPKLLLPALMPWGLLIGSAALVFGVGQLFRWPRGVVGALLLLVPLGNTSFLGFPLVELFLGRDALPYAVVYDQLGSFLALCTYGSFITALYSGARVNPFAVLRRVATFPPLWALMLGVLSRDLVLPTVVLGFLSRLADTLIPVVMVAVGFQLRLSLAPGLRGPLLVGLGVKMGLAPLLALGVVRALGVEDLVGRTTVLEAGMPPQISAGALAIAAGLAPELVGAMVGLGIVLAPLTLWLLMRLG